MNAGHTAVAPGRGEADEVRRPAAADGPEAALRHALRGRRLPASRDVSWTDSQQCQPELFGGSNMTVELNHTIIHARDWHASAKFLAGVPRRSSWWAVGSVSLLGAAPSLHHRSGSRRRRRRRVQQMTPQPRTTRALGHAGLAFPDAPEPAAKSSRTRGAAPFNRRWWGRGQCRGIGRRNRGHGIVRRPPGARRICWLVSGLGTCSRAVARVKLRSRRQRSCPAGRAHHTSLERTSDYVYLELSSL